MERASLTEVVILNGETTARWGLAWVGAGRRNTSYLGPSLSSQGFPVAKGKAAWREVYLD